MPIILGVDHRSRQVNSTAIGAISYDDIKDHLALERHFNGLPYKEFIDARAATFPLNTAEIEEVADLIRSLAGDSKLGPTAVLVSDDAAFGIIRMLETLVENVAVIKPFRKAEEASAWLEALPPA